MHSVQMSLLFIIVFVSFPKKGRMFCSVVFEFFLSFFLMSNLLGTGRHKENWLKTNNLYLMSASSFSCAVCLFYGSVQMSSGKWFTYVDFQNQTWYFLVEMGRESVWESVLYHVKVSRWQSKLAAATCVHTQREYEAWERSNSEYSRARAER